MMDNKLEKDFYITLEKLSTDNNLSLLEKITEAYIASNSDFSPSKFINYQMQLYNIFGEQTAIILHYLKNSENIDYKGNRKESFRRLNNLKKISLVHFNNMDASITAPNKLKGNLFAFNSLHPFELSGTLMRNDGEYFKFSFDFNDGLNLSSAIINNLNGKFTKGQNDIHLPDYHRLLEEVSNLKENIERLIREEDNEIAPIQEDE